MKGITKTVIEILESDEKARNSDRYLSQKFYEQFFGRPACLISIDEIMSSDVPTMDSITRVRRKVTQENPDLRGIESVEAERYEKQAEYIEWARS